LSEETDFCRCGSGEPYAECCGPLHSGEATATTAEALMRSRYCAFALGDTDYLLQTWHSTTRPETLDQSEFEQIDWLGLEVLKCKRGGAKDSRGIVEFVATMARDDKESQLREESRFSRETGQWRYLDGTLKQAQAAHADVGRNQSCPCGSGKKFKRCCGA
jgi:SEC-C motif-containing protein